MNERSRADQFVELLARHEREIATHVMVLVSDWNDAQDILQETKMAMWREFDQFEIGTNFAAWGKTIAFFRVLRFRKHRTRDRLRFSDGFVEAVNNELQEQAAHLEHRAAALAGCVERLPPDHRRILDMRYTQAMTVEEVARHSQRTVEAIYRLLSRVRRALHDCINLKLGVEQSHE